MNENNQSSSQQRKRSLTLFTDVQPISDSTKSGRPEQQQSISESSLSDIPITDSSNRIEQLINASAYYDSNVLNFATGSSQIQPFDFTVNSGEKRTSASQQSSQLHPSSMQSLQSPYLTRQEAEQENWQNSIESQTARPYQHDQAPFPLTLDRRHFEEQESQTSIKQKGKQKVKSEDIRCFWAILSSRMPDRQDATKFKFLDFDPSLEQSLGSSIDSMIGVSILDMIHPDDIVRMESEIHNHLGHVGNLGKIVRCRMRSVMSMGRYVHTSTDDKKMMGPPSFSRSMENDYQLTDVIIESIGDEMLLCFCHAATNRSNEDHDQFHKTEWSNWCGTSLHLFDDIECQSIWQHILDERSRHDDQQDFSFPTTVFQILTNIGQPKILFSWPPPRLYDSKQVPSDSSDSTIYKDGSYFADIFAKTAFGVMVDNSAFDISQAATSCTKRYYQSSSVMIDGVLIDFNTKVIPNGEIRFAISTVSNAQSVSMRIPNKETTQTNFLHDQQSYPDNVGQDRNQQAPTLSMQSQPPGMEIPVQTAFGSSVSGSNSVTALSPHMFFNGHPFPLSTAEQAFQHIRWATFGTDSTLHVSPSFLSTPTFTQLLGSEFQIEREQNPAISNNELNRISQEKTSEHDRNNSQSFSDKRSRHEGKRCLFCDIAKSPEWRKGPDGNKSLCNACGLRFSRNSSKARKKEKKAREAAEMAMNKNLSSSTSSNSLGKENSSESEAESIQKVRSGRSNTTTTEGSSAGSNHEQDNLPASSNLSHLTMSTLSTTPKQNQMHIDQSRNTMSTRNLSVNQNVEREEEIFNPIFDFSSFDPQSP